uniref:E3 ubiquitin-protein transferase MAEA n=1 Tax=Plectus sambesii TaxID=2011161 RepID=A0A914X0L4_9BILA
MSDLSALEHSTLKVPYEILNKKFRTAQKTIDRESSHVQHASGALEKCLQKDPVRVADVAGIVRSTIDKLHLLRQRVSGTLDDEIAAANMLKQRLDYLNVGANRESNNAAAAMEQWRRQRVDRLVVDYLLRAGFYDSAQQLAEQSGVDIMSNRDVFVTAKDVYESLGRHELDKCLEWAHDNKSKLRRLKSRLELAVRTQEFVELVRAERRRDAVEYARKWFSSVDGGAWQGELQRAMGLLAVGPNTDIAEYRDLLSQSRWAELMKLFCAENIRLYQLTDQSVFSACFQCGLSALKTPHCTADNRGMDGGATTDGDGVSRKDCPVCSADVYALADGLPFAHASQSRLVCAYNGQPLNEHNPPMMLPNGMVYDTLTAARVSRVTRQGIRNTNSQRGERIVHV